MVSKRGYAFLRLGVGVVVIVIIVLLGVLTPLVTLLNPATGVVHNAVNLAVGDRTYTLPGLTHNVTIIQDVNGVYHIYASDNHDLFYALGFIQAQNRLFQMEVFALTGLGNISTMLGSSYNSYDRFWTTIGAPLTAIRDWEDVLANASLNPTDNLTATALTSYAEGVNAYIAYAEAHSLLPIQFKLLGYKPFNWTPVDSFAVQELESTLEFGDDGLIFALLYYKLGNATYTLIPTFSPFQTYYYGGYNGPPNPYVLAVSHNTYPVNSTLAYMAHKVAEEWDPLTLSALSYYLNPTTHSNEWVVSGNRTTTGYPILVGGPVLSFSLPAIWFQVQLVDPSFDVYGVVLPGAPVVVIGFNKYISWTLTDTQAISDGTYFWDQAVENGEYLWDGVWHPVIHYYINGFTVNWTNLGSILYQNGTNALVVTWMGNTFSNDLGALLNVMKAENWGEFKSALEIWKAPYQNFAFEDNSTIADISPACYPIFNSTSGLPYNPSSIMPGDGQEYISGCIPYSMVPHVVNPPQGFIVSSNQRQVGPAYPYWFGNTMTFSPGFRALMEVNYLGTHPKVSVQDMMRLQGNNYTDYEAALTLPYIIRDLSNSTDPLVVQALAQLKSWNYEMDTNSTAASIWFYTYMYLYNDTFIPYLYAKGILPAYKDVINPSGMGGSLPGTTGLPSSDVVLANIIMTGNPTPFSNNTLSQLLVEAVNQAMRFLTSSYPNGNYTWGHFYGFYFPSLLGVSALSVGPLPRGGDYNTPNDASGGGPPSNWPSGGQSWTMVVPMPNTSESWGVYPGGQSENPASQFYSNYISVWMSGGYLPLYFVGSPSIFPSNLVMDTVTLLPR
ncbi:MAG: penicillin acylase family protein [Thermoprotei archaeon]